MRGKPGYNQRTLTNAKHLRRAMTDAERVLWQAIRSGQINGAKFRRQQPIGPFIADFVCQAQKLIVEIDGGQHSESRSDDSRTQWLEQVGYRVIRFWNNDALANLEGVLTQLSLTLATPHPPTAARRAPPSPSRGEGISGAI